MITLDQYNSEQGFLGGEQQGNIELQKAMQAGNITGRDTDGLPLTQEPLKAESLERTLKLLEFRIQDIKLWNALPKLTAYNTVEEFLQLSSYGTQRGGFYDEGELSDVEDSTYIRRSELVKYMQVTGEVTMQAQMVRSFIDAMRKETENKMMWILRLANKSLTKADSDIIPQEFNSLYKQHASIGAGGEFLYATFEEYYNSNTLIDLRGASLKQENVEDGAVTVDDNFGSANTIFAPTTVISALAQDYYADQRILMNGNGFKGTIGTVPKAISTTLGDINLMSDKFMKADAAKTSANPATSTKAPAAPTVSAVAVAADTLSKYNTGNPTTEIGDCFYAVSAINRYGESNLAIDSTVITLAPAFGVDLTFVAGAGAYQPTGYVIYRTKLTAQGTPAGLTFYPVFKVSAAQLAAGFNGGSAGDIRDLGYYLPDTEQCFITQMDEEVMSFKQLAPISKLDLAVLSMSRRFITFLFGTPQLYAPKKKIRYINVSKTLV